MSTQLSFPSYYKWSDAEALRSRLEDLRYDPYWEDVANLHILAVEERLEELGELSIRERVALKIAKGEYKIL